jgi:hypothetical protein
VAVVVGFGNFHIGALSSHLGHAATTAGKELEAPKGGPAIWVFAL